MTDTTPQSDPTKQIKAGNKTPLYQAIHAERYRRQDLIKKIQTNTKRRLLCFVTGDAASISRQDTMGIVELLHFVEKDCELDLIIHSGGGDIDAADKLMSLVRAKIGTGSLRVIVPDMAKSAATLMAIGADSIVMSDSSELGPIDPQINLTDGKGNTIRHSVQSYLDAYQQHSATLRLTPGDVPSAIMLSKLEPATVKLFEAVRMRAQKCAEDQLKSGMLRSGGTVPYTAVAKELIDTTKWITHGQMINYQAAQRIGLVVEYLTPNAPEWENFWQLYCLQKLSIKDNEKLFESEFVSIPLSG